MISKYQMQPQVDIGLQGAAVLKDFKKHLAETGAKAETLEKVDKAIQYCEDCAEASQIIILALDWKNGLNKPTAENTGVKAEEKAEEKPAKKEAPKRKKVARKKEEPKPEPAPTLFDASEAPKEEPKEEPKAEEPAADDSLDDLF